MTSGNFFLEKLSPSSLLDATQDKRRKHTQLPSQEPSKEHCLQKRGAVSFRVHSGRADTQRPAAQPSRTHSASSLCGWHARTDPGRAGARLQHGTHAVLMDGTREGCGERWSVSLACRRSHPVLHFLLEPNYRAVLSLSETFVVLP